MSGKERHLEEKINRLKAAVNIEEYDRPPVVATADLWPVIHVGKYTVQETFYDADKLAESYNEVFKEFPEWDAFGTVFYNIGPALDALGSKRWIMPGQGISENAAFQNRDLELMKADEYHKLIENPVQFQVEEILPKLHSRLSSEPEKTKALLKAAYYFAGLDAKTGVYKKSWADNYGIPPLFQGTINMPLDWVADRLRGFMNCLIDVKKNSKDLLKACDALVPFFVEIALNMAKGGGDYPFIFNPQHVGPFLSPKDFDKYYWPSFKKVVDGIVGAGHKLFIFFEGNMEQHLECLQNLPAGKIVARFEKVDFEKAKKYLGGKICIAGGMPSNLLIKGTTSEVKEHTLKMLDLFADTGGFIMTADTGIPFNAKPENIKVWLDTVVNY